MSRYVLDTSAYSQFNRGDARVVALIDSALWIGVPTVVLGELEAGFLLGAPARLEKNRSILDGLMNHPAVEELGIDRETSRIYAEILIELRQSGLTIPTNDIWIAATAAQSGARVLTYDEHFRAVQRIGSLVLKPFGALKG